MTGMRIERRLLNKKDDVIYTKDQVKMLLMQGMNLLDGHYYEQVYFDTQLNNIIQANVEDLKNYLLQHKIIKTYIYYADVREDEEIDYIPNEDELEEINGKIYWYDENKQRTIFYDDHEYPAGIRAIDSYIQDEYLFDDEDEWIRDLLYENEQEIKIISRKKLKSCLYAAIKDNDHIICVEFFEDGNEPRIHFNDILTDKNKDRVLRLELYSFIEDYRMKQINMKEIIDSCYEEIKEFYKSRNGMEI